MSTTTTYAESIIPKLLLARMDTFDWSPSVRVAMPDVKFTPQGNETFLDVDFIPNETGDRALGAGDASRFEGFLQVTVAYVSGRGILAPHQLVGAVIEHFPKGLVLNGDGVRVRISRRGWASPSLEGADRIRIPISIPYVAFV